MDANQEECGRCVFCCALQETLLCFTRRFAVLYKIKHPKTRRTNPSEISLVQPFPKPSKSITLALCDSNVRARVPCVCMCVRVCVRVCLRVRACVCVNEHVFWYERKSLTGPGHNTDISYFKCMCTTKYICDEVLCCCFQTICLFHLKC